MLWFIIWWLMGCESIYYEAVLYCVWPMLPNYHDSVSADASTAPQDAPLWHMLTKVLFHLSPHVLPPAKPSFKMHISMVEGSPLCAWHVTPAKVSSLKALVFAALHDPHVWCAKGMSEQWAFCTWKGCSSDSWLFHARSATCSKGRSG